MPLVMSKRILYTIKIMFRNKFTDNCGIPIGTNCASLVADLFNTDIHVPPTREMS